MRQPDILHQLDVEMAARHARVREMLKDKPEALADYDRSMKDLRLGVTSARNIWHSISEPQRAILRHLAYRGGRLEKMAGARYGLTRYWGGGGPSRIMLATVRALGARSLIDWDGGAIDPEAAAILSEHGAFVVKHGATKALPK